MISRAITYPEEIHSYYSECLNENENDDISLKNEVVSCIDNGIVKLEQGKTIYDNGYERHSFQCVGVNKDGSMINIIKTGPGKYFIMRTTI